MDSTAPDDAAIAKACRDQFGLGVDVGERIVWGVPVGPSAKAIIFKTSSGQIYMYILSRGAQLLADVQKIVLRMQCEAETYFPPHGEKEYFDRIGREKFKMLFPGKHIISDDDIRHYKGLAPYNPALMKIGKIKGEIRAYDEHLKTWRKVKDYSYSKIATI